VHRDKNRSARAANDSIHFSIYHPGAFFDYRRPLIDHDLVLDAAPAFFSRTSISVRFGRMSQEAVEISAGLWEDAEQRDDSPKIFF